MGGSKPLQPDTTPRHDVSAPPSAPGYSGHHDHSYTLQAIMDMRQSVGELKSSIENLNATVQSMKSKVEDLVNWKNRILGGALVLGAVIAVISFLIAKFSDYVTISSPQKPAVVQQAAPPPIFPLQTK